MNPKTQMLSKNSVPINKGNFTTLESPERLARFEQYRAEGWEAGCKEYREQWSRLPAEQTLRDYPVQVDAELSNVCNLRCPMCFRRHEEYNKKDNVCLMEYDLFTKIIDEIGGKVPALRLSLRGETTLYPRLVDCIRYAKEHGIGETSFLTNGSKLDPDLFEALLDAGIDWITISVDGLGETYESIRQPLKFEDTLARIAAAHEIKKRRGVHRPVIKVQTVWPAIRANPQTFYDTFAPITDLVAFNPLIDYLGNDQLDQIEYLDNFTCPQHYQRLVIGADGTAMMCTNDEENTTWIGNANDQTIHEIWHGEPLTQIRSLHKQNRGHREIPVCRKCFLPRKTETCETARVNGRQIAIENYVNRSQTIGT